MENNRPLGLFQYNGKTIGNKTKSNTFNGYFIQNTDLTINISPNSQEDVKFIMQSGPYFDLSQLQINYNEKTGRRHVIAKDSQDNFYIFSIFTTDSFISGPTLDQIPIFFTKPEIQKIANFTEILTLDGGSASTFYSPTASIHESTFIGSLLCWK